MKKSLTFEDYRKAADISDPLDAAVWLGELITRYIESSDKPITQEEAEKAVKENIAYVSGYMDKKTQKNVKETYDTLHPIWGDKDVSANEAYKMGIAAAQYVNRYKYPPK